MNWPKRKKREERKFREISHIHAAFSRLSGDAFTALYLWFHSKAQEMCSSPSSPQRTGVRGLSVTCIDHTQFTSLRTGHVCGAPWGCWALGGHEGDFGEQWPPNFVTSPPKINIFNTYLFTYRLHTSIILICDLTSRWGAHGGNDRMRQSKWDASSNCFVREDGNCLVPTRAPRPSGGVASRCPESLQWPVQCFPGHWWCSHSEVKLQSEDVTSSPLRVTHLLHILRCWPRTGGNILKFPISGQRTLAKPKEILILFGESSFLIF